MSKTSSSNGLQAQTRRSASPTHKPLTSRPLDLLYVTFFLVHIPITIFCDLQVPQWHFLSFFPAPIRDIPKLALRMIGDPLIAAMMGYNGDMRLWKWFESFLVLEVAQLAIYVLGARGLIKDSPRIYPLLLLYASAVTTTVIPCLATILATPLSDVPAIDTLKPGGALAQWTITPAQRASLIPTYLVWLILPLVMTVDMTLRLEKLVGKAVKAEAVWKLK